VLIGAVAIAVLATGPLLVARAGDDLVRRPDRLVQRLPPFDRRHPVCHFEQNHRTSAVSKASDTTVCERYDALHPAVHING
jgi:hypothetical protein